MPQALQERAFWFLRESVKLFPDPGFITSKYAIELLEIDDVQGEEIFDYLKEKGLAKDFVMSLGKPYPSAFRITPKGREWIKEYPFP